MLKKIVCLAVVLMAAHSTAWATITPVTAFRNTQARVNQIGSSQTDLNVSGAFLSTLNAGNPPYTRATATQNTTLDPDAGHFFGNGGASASLIAEQPGFIRDDLYAISTFRYDFTLDAAYRYDLSIDLVGLGLAASPNSPPMGGALVGELFRIDVPQIIASGDGMNQSGILAPGNYRLTMVASAYNIIDDNFTASVVGPSPDTGLFNSFSFDLKLTPTPEPATFVLVGLAGAGLMLRRRRVA